MGSEEVEYDDDALRAEIIQSSYAMEHSPRLQTAIANFLDKGKTAVRRVLRRSPSPVVRPPARAASAQPSPQAPGALSPAPAQQRNWFGRRSPTPPRGAFPGGVLVPPARPASVPAIALAAPVTTATTAAKKPVSVSLSSKPRPSDYYDNFGLRPSPRLLLILLNNAHLPLTACTNAAIRRLNTDSFKFKTTKWTDGEGQTKQMVDLSSLEPEHRLTPDLWREAWRNIFTVFEMTVDGGGISPEVAKMWHDHYDWLCRQRDFNEVFASILEFDIDQRNQWWTSTEKFDIGVNSSEYRDSFRAVCDSNVRRALNSVHRSAASSAASPAFHPYAPSSGGERSFRGEGHSSGSRSRDGSRTPTTCLVCSATGHSARACSRTTLPNGRPAYCAWDRHAKKLVAAGTKRVVCILWNIRADNQPCGPNCGEHKCAFCGSAEHRASSRRCL